MKPLAATRAVAHVDMDAFFASVEQRDRPELVGRPVIVGGALGSRGVVSAASYEARRFGVHSAMPISRAARLCPEAAFLPVDMAKYRDVSAEIMGILADFSPVVEPVSIDEAFVDLTGTDSVHGSPLQAVRAIKARIRAEVRLTASAGLAPNKFLAKVASDLEKPDGLVQVEHGGEAAFLAPLPVGRIWGVGRVTAAALGGLGIVTIGQLQRVPREVLVRRYGKHGAELHELAFGRDSRAVVPFTPPKSMGAEVTFPRDVTDRARLLEELRAQAERVARELRDDGFAGASVVLKIRFADWQTLTRTQTSEPTQDGLEIYRRAAALLAREPLRGRVRLIGVSISRLGPARSGQLSLLDPAALRRERLADVVDRLTKRFGAEAVRPASLAVRRPRDRAHPEDR